MTSALTLGMAAALVAGSITAALAGDQASIDATLRRLGASCKNTVAAKFPGVSMADIQVSVAATFQQSLDDGSMTLKDLRKYGASYNWAVPGKKAEGSCEVNAKGKVTQFIGPQPSGALKIAPTRSAPASIRERLGVATPAGLIFGHPASAWGLDNYSFPLLTNATASESCSRAKIETS